MWIPGMFLSCSATPMWMSWSVKKPDPNQPIV